MIKGVHFVRSGGRGKPIKWYVYAYRGGPLILKQSGARRPTLGCREIDAIKDALDGLRKVDPDLMLSLIRQWRSQNPDRPSSPEWAALSAGTKKTWGAALDLIEARWAQTPLAVWNDPRMTAKVVAWRDSRSATPRAADIGVTVLRALLEFGRLRGRVAINAATNIPALYRNGARAEIVWTDEDIARFGEHARASGKEHVFDGLRLAAATGLRREDLVTLTWAHVGEFAIVKKAMKRSAGKRRHVTIPRVRSLDRLLGELQLRFRKPGVETVLVNSHGEAWSGDGYGGSFNRIRDAANIVHKNDETGELIKKHLHDVRGTFCTRLLVDAGLTDVEAAGIMGWSTEKVASIRRLYVDQTKLVIALGERMMAIG